MNARLMRLLIAFILGYAMSIVLTSAVRANATEDALINGYRTSHGLNALAPTLTAFAEQRAVQIQSSFSHDFWWWEPSGCQGIGENILWYRPAPDNPEQQAMDSFLGSATHYANIVGTWTNVGTAVVVVNDTLYAVQLFGLNCGGAPAPTPTPKPQPKPVTVAPPKAPAVVLPNTAMEVSR